MRDDIDKLGLRVVAALPIESGPPPMPASRYGSDKLLPLDKGGAYLSSRFQKDREGLKPDARAKVDTMLELFFQPGIGTHIPSESRLGLKAKRFVCQLGTIHYHLSPEHDARILQSFELSGPGGGGKSVVEPAAPRGSEAVPCNDDNCSGNDRRIAAQFHHLMDWSSVSARRVAFRALRTMEKGVAPCSPRVKRRARAKLRGDRLLMQIADSCHTLWLRPDPSLLPEWSLLGSGVTRVEQLQNDYARAIFAGEAIRQLGRSLSLFSEDARSLDHWRRRRGDKLAASIDPYLLLEETLRILRAIHSPRVDRNYARSCYYVTLSLADDVLGSDMRCLALVRSEMIFHFSTVLSDYSDKKYQDLAFRYAKFAHFTDLSKEFFGVDRAQFSVNHVLIECKPHSHENSWLSEELVRNIQDYGIVSDAIAESLVGDTTNEIPGLQDLCVLASQIILGNDTVHACLEQMHETDQP